MADTPAVCRPRSRSCTQWLQSISKGPGWAGLSVRRLLALLVLECAALWSTTWRSGHGPPEFKVRGRIAWALPLASTWVPPERAPSRAAAPPGYAAILLHGLDAWRATWQRAAAELAGRGVGSLAVDVRGHGESPLGDPRDFEPDCLASDVRATARAAGLPLGRSRLVLIGHSMGGRIALRYAAEYPEDVAVLILEDIDCVPRALQPLPEEEQERRRGFHRAFPSWASCRQALLSFGYAPRRVDYWWEGNPPSVLPLGAGGVWSTVCPYAQHLGQARVLASPDGLAALREVAALRRGGRGPACLRALVAGPRWTVCSWTAEPGGLADMCTAAPGLRAVEFPRTSHSIHRAAPQEFAEAVEASIREAHVAQAQTASSGSLHDMSRC